MEIAKGAKLRYIYGICLSIFSVLVGILFIVQTWSIYHSLPQSPYTVENIQKHFQEIALPVWLWVAAVFGNILLAMLYPEQEQRPKAYIDSTLTLQRAKRQMSAHAELQRKTSATGKKERKFRLFVCVACFVIVLAMAVVGGLIVWGVWYSTLIEREFFVAHDGVVDKLVQCVILSAFALAFVCVCVGLNENSRKRESAYYQKETAKLLAEQKDRKISVTDKKRIKANIETLTSKKQEKGTSMKIWCIRGGIFVFAIVLLIVGIVNGGMREVFVKAINICTQCIGLG